MHDRSLDSGESPPPRGFVPKIGDFGPGLARVWPLDVWQLFVEAPWDTKGVPLSGYAIMSRVGPLALCYLFCPFGNQVVALSLVSLNG